MFSAAGYFFSRGIRNIWHNRLMSFASAGIVAAALLLFGIFLLLSMNVSALLEQIEARGEINVYLAPEAQGVSLNRIEAELRGIGGVESVRFVSREERLQKIKETAYQGREYLLEDIEADNRLRDMYVLSARDISQAEQIAQRAAQIEGVQETENRQQLIDWVRGIGGTARKVGFWLMLVLALTAMFIVANTIRLGLLSRSREVNIMRYVGASNWYIRGPFMAEGLILGLLGAAAAAVLTLWGYRAALGALSRSPLTQALSPTSFAQARRTVVLCFLAMGAGIGLLGSGISIRKYLKV